METINHFLDTIKEAGIHYEPFAVKADGQWHRFKVRGEKSTTGTYRLTVEGDFAFGNFRWWKGGVFCDYVNKGNGQKVTKADHDRIESEIEKQKARLSRDREEAAAKAKEQWNTASSEGGHPYLEKKKIPLIGARILNGNIIIPMYLNRKICGAQTIDSSGGKKFTWRCQKGYMVLGDIISSPKVILCEGWATGVTLHSILALPVVVGFDAYNLLPTAKAVREAFPSIEIIIAADNDRFTLEPIENPGITMANKAASAVGASILYPEFLEEDAKGNNKNSDFNDVQNLYGLEAVKSYFGHEKKDITHVVADWRQKLMPGNKEQEGFPFKYDAKSAVNIHLFLKYAMQLGNLVVYDEFADDIKIIACPPWENPEKFEPRQILESDFFRIQMQLERLGMKVGKLSLVDAVYDIAQEYKINPARDYMSALVWDQEHRLDTWLKTYVGASQQSADYLKKIGSKWLIGAVNRVMVPGCKFDTVLILEGIQGLGKSSILRELATIGGNEYFLDNVGDIRNKDTLMTMQGNLIIEMAELASFKKAENEEIKGFITRQVDVYRPPYGRLVIKRKRMFVLAASTNETDIDGYLTDLTGGRRYWPVQCGIIDIEGMRRDREQLWAEAAYRYKQGESTWLNSNESVHANEEQKKRFVEDVWQPILEEAVDKSTQKMWSTEELCGILEINKRDISNMTKNRIKKAMEMIGWKESRVTIGNARPRKWVRLVPKDIIHDNPIEYSEDDIPL